MGKSAWPCDAKTSLTTSADHVPSDGADHESQGVDDQHRGQDLEVGRYRNSKFWVCQATAARGHWISGIAFFPWTK